MARPSEYKEEYIQVAEEYIKSCSREATEIPTVEGLALTIGVDADTIGNWGKEYPEFFGTIKELKDKQKNQLMQDGLYGGKEVNQAMAIFLLKANHGMVETDRHEIGGVNGNTEPIRLLVNAGQGFIPASLTLSSAPNAGTTAESATVQGTDMAPESTKDIHSDNGDSQTGSS